jgi:hypothetical protein
VTVFHLPIVYVDGVALDSWRVLLPLEYGYGRSRPDQQPDPGGCQFEYVGEPTFQRGSRLEIELDGNIVWRGDVTAREVSWQSINDEPVYQIVGTGWAYRGNRAFLRDAVWIPAGTDAQQVQDLIDAFAASVDAGVDPPVTLQSVTDPSSQQGWWLPVGREYLQALQEHGSTTGSTVWERASGVRYVGAAYRETAPPPVNTIRRALVEMPLEYTESEIVNRVTMLYGRFPQDSDGSTVGEWQWRLGAGPPAAGQVYWDLTTQTLRIHEVDNNGTNQRLNLLNAIEGNGVYVLSPVETRRLTGVVNARSITGQVFALTLIDASSGAAGLPTNNAVCSISTGSPSGELALVVEDLPSQAQFGIHETSVTTYYSELVGVGARGNRVIKRWKRPRWLHTITVNLSLPSSEAEFDMITRLEANDTVNIDGVDEQQPGLGGGTAVFVEGMIHSWDRKDDGEPVLRVQLGTSPVSAWTELSGYGVGPYGAGPYGGSA